MGRGVGVGAFQLHPYLPVCNAGSNTNMLDHKIVTVLPSRIHYLFSDERD